MEENRLAQMRKNNIKLYPIYEMIGIDFLFYYGIQILFLSQVKNISDANIILVSSLYACFSIIFQVPISIFVDKVGKRKSLIIGNALNTFCMFLVLIVFYLYIQKCIFLYIRRMFKCYSFWNKKCYRIKYIK